MFKNFIDKFTGKDNKVEDSSEAKEHETDKKDDLNENKAEREYHGVEVEEMGDTSKPNLFRRLRDGLSKTKKELLTGWIIYLNYIEK